MSSMDAASCGPAAERLRRDVRACLMPGFDGFSAPDWVLDALGDGEAGGLVSVCVYGGNVRDAEQLRALGAQLREAAPQALIAIDEEGGEVTRLHYREGSPYPGAAVLGRIDDEAYTERIGARVAHDILGSGFNLALAPVADVNSNPGNPVIGTRSFSADPARAGRHAAAFVRGLQRAGAVACPKHFPGHGDTAQDSHLALPTVDVDPEIVAARDLPPFGATFAAGARTVMTSHILLPQLDETGPATFSRVILQDLLRGELGFTGVIVSDALDMAGASGEIGIPEAAVRALAAGCELLCLGTDTTPAQLREVEDHVLQAVDAGRLDAAALRTAADRVRALAIEAAPAAPAAPPAVGLRVPTEIHPHTEGFRREAPYVGESPAEREAPGAEAPGAEAKAPRGEEPDAAEIARVAASFDGVEAASAWLREHPDAGVIRVDSEANMAVGAAPWGPFAAAARPLPPVREAARSFAERPRFAADDTVPLPWTAPWAGSGAIVIGRDLHRRPFARSGIDALRASGAPVLTIETGWPGTDPGYADLACYGSSSLVGAALLTLFEPALIESPHS